MVKKMIRRHSTSPSFIHQDPLPHSHSLSSPLPSHSPKTPTLTQTHFTSTSTAISASTSSPNLTPVRFFSLSCTSSSSSSTPSFPIVSPLQLNKHSSHVPSNQPFPSLDQGIHLPSHPPTHALAPAAVATSGPSMTCTTPYSNVRDVPNSSFSSSSSSSLSSSSSGSCLPVKNGDSLATLATEKIASSSLSRSSSTSSLNFEVSLVQNFHSLSLHPSTQSMEKPTGHFHTSPSSSSPSPSASCSPMSKSKETTGSWNFYTHPPPSFSEKDPSHLPTSFSYLPPFAHHARTNLPSYPNLNPAQAHVPPMSMDPSSFASYYYPLLNPSCLPPTYPPHPTSAASCLPESQPPSHVYFSSNLHPNHMSMPPTPISHSTAASTTNSHPNSNPNLNHSYPCPPSHTNTSSSSSHPPFRFHPPLFHPPPSWNRPTMNSIPNGTSLPSLPSGAPFIPCTAAPLASTLTSPPSHPFYPSSLPTASWIHPSTLPNSHFIAHPTTKHSSSPPFPLPPPLSHTKLTPNVPPSNYAPPLSSQFPSSITPSIHPTSSSSSSSSFHPPHSALHPFPPNLTSPPNHSFQSMGVSNLPLPTFPYPTLLPPPPSTASLSSPRPNPPLPPPSTSSSTSSSYTYYPPHHYAPPPPVPPPSLPLPSIPSYPPPSSSSSSSSSTHTHSSQTTHPSVPPPPPPPPSSSISGSLASSIPFQAFQRSAMGSFSNPSTPSSSNASDAPTTYVFCSSPTRLCMKIEPWMDEAFLKHVWFTLLGSYAEPLSIKLTKKNKKTGAPPAYCFLDFGASTWLASYALSFHGMTLPWTSPPLTLHLQWAPPPPLSSLYALIVPSDVTFPTNFSQLYPSCFQKLVHAHQLLLLFSNPKEYERAYQCLRPYAEIVHQTATLFVGGLHVEVTPFQLYTLFAPYGWIHQIHVPLKKQCAFVSFFDHTQAQTALQQLNGFKLGKNVFRVGWGRATPLGKPNPANASSEIKSNRT